MDQSNKNLLEGWKCDPIAQECSPSPVKTIGFFLIGLISAISFRVIVVLQHIAADWVRPIWYIGAVGFIVFFLHRYSVSRKRHNAIKKYDLIQKLKSSDTLDYEERAAVVELLTSLDRSLEKYNFGAIFILSFIAIVLDVVLTILDKGM